ncbi:MAG: TonB-dependent receptor plug domain-containing protein, partial [Sphingomonadales bacterium]
MREFNRKLYRTALHRGVAVALIGGGFASLSVPANAQVADQLGEQEEEVVEQIVITGSRIKRDAFSSSTPLQVLDAEEASRLGVTTVSELLQRSTTSSGKQIDFSINTNAGNTNATEAPPSGGIGSSNIDLRGLGPERTLVLVNGRRFGLAGARGAPAQPDINLLPLGLVENIDILTGGLSTIYGADAVAGVVNVKLKSDFDGIDISGGVRLPEAGGGEVYRTSLVAGVSNDRGNITLGFDYYTRERASAGSRD